MCCEYPVLSVGWLVFLSNPCKAGVTACSPRVGVLQEILEALQIRETPLLKSVLGILVNPDSFSRMLPP